MGRCVYGGIYEPDHPSADGDGFRADVAGLARDLGVTRGPLPRRQLRLRLPLGGRHRPPRRSAGAPRPGVEDRRDQPVSASTSSCAGRSPSGASRWWPSTSEPAGSRRRATCSSTPTTRAARTWSDLRGEERRRRPLRRAAVVSRQRDGRARGRSATRRRTSTGASPPRSPGPCGASTRRSSSSPAAAPTRRCRRSESWESTVLEHCHDVVDHISLHAYYEQHGDDRASFLASAVDMDHMIDSVVATADAVAAAPALAGAGCRCRSTSGTSGTSSASAARTGCATTARRRSSRTTTPSSTPSSSAACSSACCATADRVHIACQAQLVNVIAPIRTEPGGPAWRQSTFDPFAATARHARGDVLLTHVDSPRQLDGPLRRGADARRGGDVRRRGRGADGDPRQPLARRRAARRASYRAASRRCAFVERAAAVRRRPGRRRNSASAARPRPTPTRAPPVDVDGATFTSSCRRCRGRWSAWRPRHRMTTGGTRGRDWTTDAPFRFAVGIEDTFIPQELPGQRRLDEYELTQHYQFWRDDLDLLARSGADSMRWGIPWYRVEPEPGRFEWDWVDRVIDHIGELGLTCIVDLMHYGTPLWMTDRSSTPTTPGAWPPTPPPPRRRYGDRLARLDAAQRAQRQRRLLRPPRGVAAASHRRGGVHRSRRRRSPRASSRRSGRSSDVQPDASFVYVEAGFRYAGDTFPMPEAILEERRFVVLDLALGRVDDRHPMRDWLTGHGADSGAARRPDGRPASPRRPRRQLLPGLLDASASTTPAWRSRSRPAPTASTRSCACYAARYGLPVMITETSRGGPLEERRTWLRESLAASPALRAAGIAAGRLHVVPVHRPDRLGLPRGNDADRRLARADGHGRPPSRPGGGALERHPTALLDDYAAAVRRGMPPPAWRQRSAVELEADPADERKAVTVGGERG